MSEYKVIEFRDVKKLLNPVLFSNLKIEMRSYQIFETNPINFLTSNRLDLIAKYLYCLNKNKYTTTLYINTIKCINNFNEADYSGKIGEMKFINSFNELILSIKQQFDPSISIIPVDQNFNIIDGAHRIAASVAENKTVYYLKLDLTAKHELGYEFFKKNNLSTVFLEDMVLEYIKIKSKVRTAFIFPNNTDNGEYAINLMKNNCNILYQNTVSLTETGKENLIYYLYKNEPWIGNEDNNFIGISRKKEECFKYGSDIHVVFLENDNEKINDIKLQIRNYYKLSNHSIHTNDTYEETISLSELLLNKNGIHFLNNHKRRYTSLLTNKLEEFSLYLISNKINRADVVIDSSFILGLYGLRMPKDLDFIISDEYSHIQTENHNIYYQNDEIEKLIYNPLNYFYFQGFKILSIDRVIEMKKLRGEIKDVEDLNLMINQTSFSSVHLEELYEKIYEYSKKRKLIVFGSQALCYKLSLFNLKVSFIVDNKIQESESFFFGDINIYNPNFLKKFDKSQLMIIVPNHHFPSISSQLRGMGFIQNEHFFNSDLVITSLSSYPNENKTIIYEDYNVRIPKGCSLLNQITVDGYEPLLVNSIHRELKLLHHKNLTMVDIGANIGLISFSLIKSVENLKVFAFEPSKGTFDLLNESVELNDLSSKMKTFNTAVGDYDGYTQFFIHDEKDSSGDGIIDTGRAGSTKEATTKICKFDTWVKQNNVSKINVIKIDVEGAELLVLKGAIETIKRDYPIIFMELLDVNIKNYPFEIRDIFGFIDEINYSCFSLTGDTIDINNYFKFDTVLLRPNVN